MEPFKLYGPRSGSSLRGHWAFQEAEVAYEAIAVDMKTDERKRPEFLKMNPMGQVPVLIAGDWVLTESLAILRYVIQKYKPELLGTPEEEAQALRWSVWALLNPQKHLLDWAMQGWQNTNDPVVIAKAKENLEKNLAVLDAWLGTHAYVAGDRFTFGDMSVACSMLYTEYCGYDYQAFTNIARWMKEITMRPAFQAARGN